MASLVEIYFKIKLASLVEIAFDIEIFDASSVRSYARDGYADAGICSSCGLVKKLFLAALAALYLTLVSDSLSQSVGATLEI